ncbi:MAG: hypothetical protein E7562_07845 [Ruminococcaceae bacterium]|nr:hypothetical protein [Oscillospiraceae bacterium]
MMSVEEKGNLKYEFLMSQIKHICDIKESEKTKLSVVFYEPINSSCILRVCKGRDLTEVYSRLAEIRNPNTVVIYDFAYANGNTYIIEENLSGETVEKIMAEEGNFSEDETAKIVSCVCKGLSELHKMKPPVVHNDINISNIMIRDDHNVKLFDFDISRTYKKGAHQNTVLFGTEEYASPEHFGYGQSEPRTDIYCLGVTMHKMLTGKGLGDEHNVLYNGRLKGIINKCIEIDAKKRYASVDALKKALEKFLQRKKRIFQKIIAFLCVALLITATVFVISLNSNDKNDSVFKDDSLNNDTNVQTGEDESTIPQDTSSGKNDDTSSKKVKVIKSLEGEVLSMVTLNDGTIVYLEEISEEYHIKTSTGKDMVAEVSFSYEHCALIYNSYSDKLYLVNVPSGGYAYIYSVDKSFNVEKEPLYNAEYGSFSNIKGIFFDDGTLYCNAFRNEIIDASLWCEMGDLSFPVDAVIGDFLYGFDSYGNIVKMNFSGETVESFELPAEVREKNNVFRDKNNLYFTVNIDQKDYIYKFDGESFEKVVCLNDYKYYTGLTFDSFCVGKDVIWLYEKQDKTIKEIKF